MLVPVPICEVISTFPPQPSAAETNRAQRPGQIGKGGRGKGREISVFVEGRGIEVVQNGPFAAIDLVAVPELFGAMENPGLITFDEPMLVGDERVHPFANYFVRTAAHEIVHQWFGNVVTPAWWDDLWLSEAFASWLGDKVTRELGALDDAPLELALARRRAIEADADPEARPLHRAIATNREPDESFDALYEKGYAVLATVESFVGEDAFRELLRGYLRRHRDRTATIGDLTSALAATDPRLPLALTQLASTTRVPVVELALRCEGKPVIVAHARDGATVPMTVHSITFAQYTPTSPYLLNPDLAIGYTDSCANFWLQTWDSSIGGFFTNIDKFGNVITGWGTNKNMLTQSRNAYGLVRAYMLTGDTIYLSYAKNALDWMYEHAWDEINGGWLQELNINGVPINPTANKTAFYQH